jgi:hypothetical protein
MRIKNISGGKMTRKNIQIGIGFIAMLLMFKTTTAQRSQTMGVFINDTSKVFDGYLLFAPKQNSMTYLIDNEGHKVHEWSASTYAPGQSVYLLENGNLLRTCMTQGSLGTGGGEGGRIELYNWDDSLLWYMNYSTTTYMQHHDIKILPNGNIIMLVVEKKTLAEVEAAGFDTSKIQEPDWSQKKIMLPDAVIEIAPTYPSGGTVVWEWHVWDHLIQSHDATKNNYGTPGTHPELIDCAGDHRNLPIFWNHMNAIDYNPTFDQIAMSVRGNSEVWIIDHSTTTAQSASHAGGTHGKGGDLLYRWGNPLTYGQGTVSNQTYFEQHDVEWIKSGCPGAGNLLCFNNGVNRNYSSIDEFTPPVDANGNYTYTSGAYGPTSLTWTYVATPPSSMYALDISGAQRLQNGNTIICVGPTGTFYEVTSSGQIAWKYINPVTNTGPLTQGDSIPHNYPSHPDETLNSVFRVYKYAKDYSGFTGHDMTPGDFIELYPVSINDLSGSSKNIISYPNPFTDKIYLINTTGKEEFELMNIMGQSVWKGKNIEQQDFSNLGTGIYLLKINSQNNTQTIKLIKQ